MKRRIGKYVSSPSPSGPTKRTYREAKIVDDSIAFHGAALAVKVHHAYPSRLFKNRSISIAGGRGVELVERGIRVWIDDHLVSIELAPRRARGSKEPPPFGAMANELSHSELRRFPIIYSYKKDGTLAGMQIFHGRANRRVGEGNLSRRAPKLARVNAHESAREWALRSRTVGRPV